MAAYTFPKENLQNVIDHANALDVVVDSLVLDGDVYRLTSETDFPEEQLAHLGLMAV